MTDWKDLIFSPLDLPDPPELDMDKFISWNSAQKEYMLELNTNRQNSMKLLGGYAWQISWAKRPTVNNSTKWICDFDKIFPEITEYLELFPMKEIKSISILNQIGGSHVEPHVDPDELWGMRFYLKNKIKDALYFSRTKEKQETMIRTLEDSDGKPLTQKRNYLDYCKDEKIYAKFPKERCAWLLNCNRAWHGVDKNPTPTGTRITCLVMGEYDTNKLFKLLEESTKQYKDYQIWY